MGGRGGAAVPGGGRLIAPPSSCGACGHEDPAWAAAMPLSAVIFIMGLPEGRMRRHQWAVTSRPGSAGRGTTAMALRNCRTGPLPDRARGGATLGRMPTTPTTPPVPPASGAPGASTPAPPPALTDVDAYTAGLIDFVTASPSS